MLENILPSCVAVAEAYDDVTGPDYSSAEAALVAGAVAERRREFATGRECARRALTRLGRPPDPVLAGPRGEPLWPRGITGSLTHCDGYRAAAVAAAGDVTSLGIDAEPSRPLPDDVLPLVTDAGERQALSMLERTHPGIAWARVLFSAKESVYKAWYPLARRWLGFEDVALVLAPHDGTFTALLRVPGPSVRGLPLRRFRGRWASGDGLVLTAVVV
jgi:4'-phosphopantetheinyl transferase EntD